MKDVIQKGETYWLRNGRGVKIVHKEEGLTDYNIVGKIEHFDSLILYNSEGKSKGGLEALNLNTIYRRGDRFEIEEDEYILAHVDSCTFSLINLSTGNRFTDPIKISRPTPYLFRDELDRLTEYNAWRKL